MLKIYGDADVTVSLWIFSFASATSGSGSVGGFCTWYFTWVFDITSLITNGPSYPVAFTPWIRIGVSTSTPGRSVSVVTVITDVAITPSPALMLLMPTSSPIEPTILNSLMLVWISTEAEG